ncbi:stage II sporulation protein M [Haloarchaeobius baliensis]|uniref:stage II sporulation protein M n=1 Tax=Haloarchaeobius baliensis TaxID=1670458 RepID=UPI003F881B91
MTDRPDDPPEGEPADTDDGVGWSFDGDESADSSAETATPGEPPETEPSETPPPGHDDPPTLSWDGFALAWREHRRYTAFSAMLFLLSIPLGIALWEVGFDLFGAMGFDSPSEMFPDDITALFIFLNNTRAFFVFILGALTGGILTTIGLVFNGVLVGYVVTPAAAQEGYGFVLLALLPHGVLELPALFVGAAIAYRFLANIVLLVFDRRDHFYTRGEVKRTGLLVVVSVAALAVAAVVEMHVTTWLLDQVYGTPAP